MGTCPVCEQELVQSTFLDIEVEGCTMCGGIRFPKGGAQAAIARAPLVLHRLDDEFQDLRLSKDPLPRKLTCPQCTGTMRRAAAKQIPGFEPHVCAECGSVWAADGLLILAETHFKAQRAKEDKAAAESAPPEVEPIRPPKPPTLVCAGCGNVNRANEGFCLKCDAPLEVRKREGHLEGQCPRCHKALYTAPRAGTRVQACSDCGGLWIPLTQLTELLDDGAKHLGKLDTDFRVHPHTPGEQREVHRCPDCGADLADVDYTAALPSGALVATGEPVHECPACREVWFDSGESHQLSLKVKSALAA